MGNKIIAPRPQATLPELITVDLRGVTLTKGGGSRDEVIERFNWTTIEAATAALHELERLIND